MKITRFFVPLVVLALGLGTNRLAAQTPDSSLAPWWSRVSAGADFRARIESFQQDDSPGRLRSRMRLRVSAGAAINNEVDVGVRVVTGNPFDPITANQTFTDWSVRKPITLDRAFITYHPAAIPVLKFGAGKFEYPIRVTNMVFDDNLSWEGGYEQLKTSGNSLATWTLTAVQSPMNEIPDARDSYLFVESGQGRIGDARRSAALTVSSLRFTNPGPLGIAIDEEKLDARNTNLLRRDADGNVTGFASEFNLLDIVGDASIATARKDYPLSLTADFVKNMAARTDRDHGVWVEAQYGSAERQGTWSVGYTFSRIEQDAVLSPFLFDDMLGTNAMMHIASASYVPLMNTNIDLTFVFGKWLPEATGYNPNLLTRIQLSVRAHL
jgi:hypothetical protein